MGIPDGRAATDTDMQVVNLVVTMAFAPEHEQDFLELAASVVEDVLAA